MKIGDDIHKPWAPTYCCSCCSRSLRGWLAGTHASMPFGIPMIWREQKDHVTDCYFCLTKTTGYSTKNKHLITYPNLPSAIRPQPHDDAIPVPTRPTDSHACDSSDDTDDSDDNEGQCSDDNYSATSHDPHFLTQTDLNDLIRDLKLSKSQAELLGSRLKQWNLLDNVTKISIYRKRHNHFASFFAINDTLVFCQNIPGLIDCIGLPPNPSDWRLFLICPSAV